jgi:hypothetical protein
MHGVEAGQDLNAVCLQNAVLCVECEVVSNSPHDHCLVCGSHSLFSLSRVLGGPLAGRRATVVETQTPEVNAPKVVLNFPSTYKKPCRRTVVHKTSRRRA